MQQGLHKIRVFLYTFWVYVKALKWVKELVIWVYQDT